MAWAILMRRDDVTLDDRGAAWLAKVAIHEGWRLASTTDETPIGIFQGTSPVGDDPHIAEPADTTTPTTDEQALAHIEHGERVADLRALKPRERRTCSARTPPRPDERVAPEEAAQVEVRASGPAVSGGCGARAANAKGTLPSVESASNALSG